MWLKSIRNNGAIYLLIFIGIAFYVLNILTPEYLDDYLYKFTFVNGKAEVTRPIQNLKDIFVSQLDHYYTFNGRINVHSFVQLFTGIVGKNIFNIVNTLVFVSFVFFIVRFVLGRLESGLILIVSIVILTCFPAFNDTCLWMTGSINYLWSAFAALAYLLLFDKLKDESVNKHSILYLFVGLFLGWTHEGISFPIALGSLLYVLISWRKISRTSSFLLFVGFIIGALFCGFSPATLGRATTGGGFDIYNLLRRFINGFILLSNLKCFYLFIICLCWLFYRNGKKNVFQFIFDNMILFGGAFFSLGIVFLSGFVSSRTAFGLELCCFLIVIKIVSIIKPHKNVVNILSFGGIVLYSFILNGSIANYKESNEMFDQIKKNSSNVIIYDEPELGWLDCFVRKPLESSKSEYYFAFSSDYWENKFIAASYNRDSLIFLPEAFLAGIRANHFEDFYTNEDIPFYAKKIDCTDEITIVKFKLKETNISELPFYIHPFVHLFSKYTIKDVETEKYSVENVDGSCFLLVGKNHNIDNRVESVEYLRNE